MSKKKLDWTPCSAFPGCQSLGCECSCYDKQVTIPGMVAWAKEAMKKKKKASKNK